MVHVSRKGLSILHGGEAIIPSKVYKAILAGASAEFRFDKMFISPFFKLPPITFTFNREVIFTNQSKPSARNIMTAREWSEEEIKAYWDDPPRPDE